MITTQAASEDRKAAVTSLSRAPRTADSIRATNFSGKIVWNKAWTAAFIIRSSFNTCIKTHQLASRAVDTMSVNLNCFAERDSTLPSSSSSSASFIARSWSPKKKLIRGWNKAADSFHSDSLNFTWMNQFRIVHFLIFFVLTHERSKQMELEMVSTANCNVLCKRKFIVEFPVLRGSSNPCKRINQSSQLQKLVNCQR